MIFALPGFLTGQAAFTNNFCAEGRIQEVRELDWLGAFAHPPAETKLLPTVDDTVPKWPFQNAGFHEYTAHGFDVALLTESVPAKLICGPLVPFRDSGNWGRRGGEEPAHSVGRGTLPIRPRFFRGCGAGPAEYLTGFSRVRTP